MFAYLNKKVQMPAGSRVRSVGWDLLDDWMAVGATKGVLKLFHLDSRILTLRPGGSITPSHGDFASAGLLDFQSLQAHTDDIHLVSWNPVYGKLATADVSALVVVWQYTNGGWQQEMMNNRNKSSVQALEWSHSGKHICIAYADGNVILGDVSGKRLWTRDMDFVLRAVVWAPSDDTLGFADEAGKVWLYDLSGSLVAEVPNLTIAAGAPPTPVTAITWHAPLVPPPEPSAAEGARQLPSASLAIAYDTGRVQLVRGPADQRPVLLDTGMAVQFVRWSPDGTVLALAGHTRMRQPQPGSPAPAPAHKVQFYSAQGRFLRALPMPHGEALCGLAWECSGQRLVLAADSALYFAAVRRPRHALYFQGTLALAHSPAHRADTALVFHDTRAGTRHIRYAESLLCSAASLTHAALAVTTPARPARATLLICNSLGAAVDTQQLDFQPHAIAVSDTYAAAVSETAVYIWRHAAPPSEVMADAMQSLTAQFSDPAAQGASRDPAARTPLQDAVAKYPFGDPALISSSLPSLQPRAGAEWLFHADDHSPGCALLRPNLSAVHQQRAHARATRGREGSGVSPSHSATPAADADADAEDSADLIMSSMGDAAQRILAPARATPNAVTAVDVRGDLVAVARASGSVTVFRMPACAVVARASIPGRPEQVKLNADGTKAAVIDHEAVLRVIDVAPTDDRGEPVSVEGLAGTAVARKSWSAAGFERTGAWRVVWATDSVDVLAVQEKGKLSLFEGTTLDSTVPCPGYVVAVADLKATTVLADALSVDPLTLLPGHVSEVAMSAWLDFEAAMQSQPAPALVRSLLQRKQVHPCLWRSAATLCLRADQLRDAERCFSELSDADGVSLVRALQLTGDPRKRAVEVEAFCGARERVVAMHHAAGRDDLAAAALARLGDHEAALRVLASLPGADKGELEAGWARLGRMRLQHQQPRAALRCFLAAGPAAGATEGAIEACHALDDYTAALPLLEQAPPGARWLGELGRRMGEAGLPEEAVACLLKAGDPRAAVDVCVRSHQWGVAVELAQAHHLPQVGALVAQHAARVVADHPLRAAHMYYKARCFADAAGAIGAAVTRATADGGGVGRARAMKRVHVLRALVWDCDRAAEDGDADGTVSAAEAARTRRLVGGTQDSAASAGGVGGGSTMAMLSSATSATLADLLGGGAKRSARPTEPWAQAAWWHWLLLAHRQLLAGAPAQALRTARRLVEGPGAGLGGAAGRNAWALVCVSAVACDRADWASRALAALSADARRAGEGVRARELGRVAIQVFMAHPPGRATEQEPLCAGCGHETHAGHCKRCGRHTDVCVATGEDVAGRAAVRCGRCRRVGLTEEMRLLRHCPMCHQELEVVDV